MLLIPEPALQLMESSSYPRKTQYLEVGDCRLEEAAMVGRDRKKIRGGGRGQHKQGQREGRGHACITQDLFCFVLAWETGSPSVVEVHLNSIYSPD